MLSGLITLAGAFGAGFASALIPIINSELITAGFAVLPHWGLAIGAAVALAAGQTVGKIALYEAARSGRAMAEKRAQRQQEAAAPDATPSRWARWSAQLVNALDGRLRCIGVVLLSSSVGIPPLLAVAPAAGAVRMHRVDFALCCFVGRSARFATILAPLLLATR